MMEGDSACDVLSSFFFSPTVDAILRRLVDWSDFRLLACEDRFVFKHTLRDTGETAGRMDKEGASCSLNL